MGGGRQPAALWVLPDAKRQKPPHFAAGVREIFGASSGVGH